MGDAGRAAGKTAAVGPRGAGLPLSERISHVDAQKDDRRELQLFPLKGTGSTRGLLFEDDGESWGYKQGDALWLEWEMTCSASSINLDITPAATIARRGKR